MILDGKTLAKQREEALKKIKELSKKVGQKDGIYE